MTVTDAVYLLQWRFGAQAAPPAPFPACGTDLTTEDPPLGECVYTACF